MQGVVINQETGEVEFIRDMANQWRVICDMRRTRSGRFVIGGLHIVRLGAIPEEGLTIKVLKAVRLGPARAYAALNSPVVAPKQKKGKRAGAGRPAVLTQRFYREVWERYMALQLSGSKNPAKTLAEEYGYSRTGMRSVLNRCRKMPGLPRFGSSKGGRS